jgi:protein involved in polysaccharide export with SLBB domain
VHKHLISAALAVLFLCAVRPAAGQTAPAELPAGSEAILPGDVVRLTVLRDKDLSGDFPVNQFGTVVLPLVGEYDVSRESHRSLRDKVIRDLQEIRSAKDIEVVVLRRVRVVGEVNEPGVYPLDPTMTVADAVAMAKGRTQFASAGEVVLRRGGEVVDADLLLDQRVSESPIRSGDEIYIPRRGWVDRNLTAVVAGASTVATILITLLR